MNAHRQNFTPVPLDAPPSHSGRYVALVVLIASLAALSCARVSEPDNQPAPAFPPSVEGLDGAAIAQIRVEAYRAGMAAGIEQGCAAPRLSSPLGGKP